MWIESREQDQSYSKCPLAPSYLAALYLLATIEGKNKPSAFAGRLEKKTKGVGVKRFIIIK